MVYIRETYCFSVVCIFKHAIDSFEVKVDVQMGALRFIDQFDK